MAAEKMEETVVVDQQPPATEEAKPAEPMDESKPAEVPEKPVKEKKAPKEKKPKQTVSHPPYFQMIEEALLALNEKNGSSPYAIAKYMEEKHKPVLPANFRKILTLQLKNSASRGKLIKVKASYKLSEADKKDKAAPPKVANKTEKKKPKQAKSTAPRTRSANKSEAAKKPVTKKVGAKKAKKSAPAKPKQPKSIKSPAAKRTKKVSAV